MKTLYVAWKDPDTRGWYPVGRLDADPDVYHLFRYTRGALQAREEAGFQPFDAFPKIETAYESRELFPLFTNRLQNSARPGFKEYLERMDFTKAAPDPIELLALSEGRRATDNLEVFPKVEHGVDGGFHFRFFLHGWRHIRHAAEERMKMLQPQESLRVAVEVNNPATGYAIQLSSEDHIILGWAPRYLLGDFTQVIFNGGCNVNALVVRYNPPPAPPGQRLLIEFSGCWSNEYTPMGSEEFQPLVKEPEAALERSTAAA